MKKLDQDNVFTLTLDNVKHGEWWLELIERSSGKVKILVGKNKDIFEGVTIDHAMRWMIKQKWVPIYKKGIM